MDIFDYNLMVGFLDPWQTNSSLYVVISGQNVSSLQDSWTLPSGRRTVMSGQSVATLQDSCDPSRQTAFCMW